MTVSEYLALTEVKKMKFFVRFNEFEEINARPEKWGKLSYPTELAKYLNHRVNKAFVTSNGTVIFHTTQNNG